MNCPWCTHEDDLRSVAASESSLSPVQPNTGDASPFLWLCDHWTPHPLDPWLSVTEVRPTEERRTRRTPHLSSRYTTGANLHSRTRNRQKSTSTYPNSSSALSTLRDVPLSLSIKKIKRKLFQFLFLIWTLFPSLLLLATSFCLANQPCPLIDPSHFGLVASASDLLAADDGQKLLRESPKSGVPPLHDGLITRQSLLCVFSHLYSFLLLTLFFLLNQLFLLLTFFLILSKKS